MKTLSLAGALVASFVSFGSQADVPMIRFAAESPFKDGKCVEAVWSKADVCGRFVEVNKNDVSLDQSEARILFDERNLYVALKGNFDPQYDRGDVRKGMSSVNNFEFLLKPPADEYLHVIVDEFGRLYVAKGKTEARDAGVTASVAKGKGFWTANLTIPLKTAGMSAPTVDTAVKVGVFRWNINVHEREKLWANRGIASGFTPNKYNYGVPDLWADMTFTRTDGEARRVVGPSLGSRINLFPNPDFDVPERGWNAMGKTTYGETMAMSGEWIYRGSGKDYQILQGSTRWMKPSTRYTLVVKARSFGAGSALRIVEMARGKDGKIHEGVYATMLTPIGPEMHEYYLPFTSAADAPWTIVFYKVDNKADDTGLEIASIRLFEGEISSFEVRKLVRPGRMAIVPGTEKAVRPNPIGRFAKPPRTLTFIASKYLLREADEIFAGTGVKPDVLLLSGKDADVYSTYGDEKAISGRVAKGAYDLVMVPKRGAEMIGKEMAKYVRTAVEKGAGLYLEDQPKGLGRLADLVKDAKDGTLGKGRVVQSKTAGGARQYLPFAGDRATVASLFPPDIGRLRLAAELLKLASGTEPAAVKTEKTSLVYGGTVYAFEKKLDAAGATVAWTETRTPVAGPTLGAFADDGRVSTVVVTGDVAGVTLAWEFRDFSGRILAKGEVKECAAETAPPQGNADRRSGGVPPQGDANQRGGGVPPPQNKFRFVVPREKLYTNFGGIRLALRKEGKEVDVRGECVFVRDNDRKRLMDDYTPSMWPGDGDPDEKAFEVK